jgi:hypothetical protein
VPVTLLRAGDFRDMPWKNGGGRTLQLAIEPAQANLADFDWRVSMATIAQSGPFSAFPGCDRSILVVDGGFVIETAGTRLTLDQPLVPHSFNGDAPAECTLLGGPARDFNVIARRSRARATLRGLRLDGTITHTVASPTTLVVCLDGRVNVGGRLLDGLCLLRLDGARGDLPLVGNGRVVIVSLERSA